MCASASRRSCGPRVNSLRDDPRLTALLDRLHAQNDAQEALTHGYADEPGGGSTDGTAAQTAAGRTYWSDKLVALDPDKACFCYALCRALRARRVVEAGTSYGVSTLYLAAAVRDNGGGTVIATEYEASKAAIARAHFAEAQLSSYVELREGDVRDTLKHIDGPVDFLLIDIWTPLARPVIELVHQHLRPGAIVVTDHTASPENDYQDFFAFVRDSAKGFMTQTLPFEGGLELSVKL
jgi:predicted O-methyltransferase YrrM